MFKKKSKSGTLYHPGDSYRAYRSGGGVTWKALQKEFKRKKRLRKISRLARKGKRAPNSMRPQPKENRNGRTNYGRKPNAPTTS